MVIQSLNPPTVSMHALELPWVTDRVLLRSLTTAANRPSLLILCDQIEPDVVIASLVKWCAQPFHICSLPGSLALPSTRTGTLFLNDVSAMTLAQQVALNDWIDRSRGDIQIVSATETRLWPLVEGGQFLEGLYYRLNVITIEASLRST